MKRDQKYGEILLLFSQLLERIAHYSITANLTMMLLSEPLYWQNYNAVAAPLLLNGFCFTSSMVGGVLSDIYFRKTTTVIIGYVFYFSYASFPLTLGNNTSFLCRPNSSNITINQDDRKSMFGENCAAALLPPIIMSAIGSGLIRSVVASMGADMAYKKWKNPSLFFNLYYWCLNCGSLIAFMGISTLQQHYKFYGYLVPSIILAVSFVTFLMGGPFYIHQKKPSRSTFSLVFQVYVEAIKKKIDIFKVKLKKKNEIVKVHSGSLLDIPSESDKEKTDDFNTLSKDDFITATEFDSYVYPSAFSINSSSIDTRSNSNIIESDSNNYRDDVSFLDRCQIRFGGSFSEIEVQDVRRFSFILAILFFMIPYYIIFFQMESTYMYQGMRMKVGIPNTQFNVPASWLICLDIILLMFLLPFLAKVIYPWLREKRVYFRETSKIALGLVMVLLSVVIAGVLEIYRLRVQWKDNDSIIQQIDHMDFTASNITIWYQVPQFVFMGFSEAFAVVAGLELTCAQVSNSMQGLANGLFWFAAGLGSFSGTGLLYIFRQLPFIPNNGCNTDIVSCHLYIYFFILAGIILVALLFFFLFLLKYRKLENIENTLSVTRVTG